MENAQDTMRQHYADGGPGVFISGVVWIVTAAVIFKISDRAGMLALVIGGMAIHPISTVIAGFLKRGDSSPPDKALTKLALLTLPLLFAGIYLAYVLSEKRIALFFAVVAMTIGVRYFIFERIYGLRVFWALGGALLLSGLFAVLNPSIAAIQITSVVGIVEIMVGVWITRQFTKFPN